MSSQNDHKIFHLILNQMIFQDTRQMTLPDVREKAYNN
jgi:hypothetical protein